MHTNYKYIFLGTLGQTMHWSSFSRPLTDPHGKLQKTWLMADNLICINTLGSWCLFQVPGQFEEDQSSLQRISISWGTERLRALIHKHLKPMAGCDQQSLIKTQIYAKLESQEVPQYGKQDVKSQVRSSQKENIKHSRWFGRHRKNSEISHVSPRQGRRFGMLLSFVVFTAFLHTNVLLHKLNNLPSSSSFYVADSSSQ